MTTETHLYGEPSAAIPVPAYVPQEEYDKIVRDLENARANYNAERNTVASLNNRLTSLKAEIKDFIVDRLGGRIGDDDLRELAENCDVELKRRVSFTVTATINCKADVDFGTDIDDILGDIDAEFNLDIDGVSNFDYDLPDLAVSEVYEGK